MSKTALVVAIPFFHIDLLDKEDGAVAGIYRIVVTDKVPANGLANAALDVFHSTVPVKSLDDFDFAVHTEDLKSKLECGEYDGYEFADERVSVDRISDLIPEVAEKPKQTRGRKP